MRSKNNLLILNGICIGIVVWIILLISDCIDEVVLDKGFFIGLIIYIIMPIILICYYIYNYIVYKPNRKNYLLGLAVIVRLFLCLEELFLYLLIMGYLLNKNIEVMVFI